VKKNLREKLKIYDVIFNQTVFGGASDLEGDFN